MRNFSSKFGHASPLGSRIIRYVRDGRTDGQRDGRTKATHIAPFPTVGGIIMVLQYRQSVKHVFNASVILIHDTLQATSTFTDALINEAL